jgi:hypothetical protein
LAAGSLRRLQSSPPSLLARPGGPKRELETTANRSREHAGESVCLIHKSIVLEDIDGTNREFESDCRVDFFSSSCQRSGAATALNLPVGTRRFRQQHAETSDTRISQARIRVQSLERNEGGSVPIRQSAYGRGPVCPLRATG